MDWPVKSLDATVEYKAFDEDTTSADMIGSGKTTLRKFCPEGPRNKNRLIPLPVYLEKANAGKINFKNWFEPKKPAGVVTPPAKKKKIVKKKPA